MSCTLRNEKGDNYPTSVRTRGTSRKNGSIFSGSRSLQWRVRTSIVFACVLSYVALHPNIGDARGLFAKQKVVNQNIILQGLNSHYLLLTSERVSSVMVQTIMALLGTIDEAGILPPEGTAQANQVIHAFIQLQSALLKSPSPELAAYGVAAASNWTSQHEDQRVDLLVKEGLTDKRLAGLIAYDQEHPLWEDPKIVSAMQAFNVTRADWELIVELFNKAKAVFRKQGRSIHIIYEAWRMNVPGEKS